MKRWAKVEKTGVPFTVAVGYHPGGSNFETISQLRSAGILRLDLQATSASQDWLEWESKFRERVDRVIEYSQGSVYIVISGHDECTANLVKLMPAHVCGAVCRVCICAHAHAELTVSLQRYINITPTLKREAPYDIKLDK